jgi:hypothetical protein
MGIAEDRLAFAESLAALNRYIETLLEVMSKTPRRRRPYGITVVLNPLDR